MNIARKALVGAFVLCCVMTCNDASTPFFSSHRVAVEPRRSRGGGVKALSYSVFINNLGVWTTLAYSSVKTAWGVLSAL